MAHFTKDGKRLYTAEQIQTRFNASFWVEYNQTSEDDSKTGTGAVFGGHAAFYLDGTRVSCASGIKHRSAEEKNKKAKEKGKKVSEVYDYAGGASNTVRQSNKELLAAESHIDALQAKVDLLERIDAGTVGDTTSSHDQAFDNREVVA
jgi:hypothetical protein